MRLATVLLLFGLAAPALAQPTSLVVTPDTLFWEWSTGYSTPFVIRNEGSSALRLDSLTIGTCSQPVCTSGLPGYMLRLEHAGRSYHGFQFGLFGWWRWGQDDTFPDVLLAPGDSARFYVEGIDPCPICFSGAFRGGAPDTFAPIYVWAAADPVPVERTLTFTYPVAAEPEPEETGLALALDGANPFRGETTLRLTLDAPAEADVALFDALGRRVRTLASGRLGAGAHRLPVAARGLAPGLYFARAACHAGRETAVVARRLVLLR